MLGFVTLSPTYVLPDDEKLIGVVKTESEDDGADGEESSVDKVVQGG